MSILERFSTIIKANINDLLDRAEDPAKMMDQYMRQLMSDLADVKRETASVMAEESRIQRQLEEKRQESAKNADLARRALQLSNEDDARVFLAKKQELGQAYAGYLLDNVEMDKLLENLNPEQLSAVP